jgi:hypothetical protein
MFCSSTRFVESTNTRVGEDVETCIRSLFYPVTFLFENYFLDTEVTTFGWIIIPFDAELIAGTFMITVDCQYIDVI